MRDMIFTNNSTSSAITQGSVVPLGNAVHGYGRGIRLINNGIVLKGRGYYDVIVNASIAPTSATTDFSLQLHKDGVAVPGAISVGQGATINLTIPYEIRKCGCDCSSSTYTIVAGSAGTVSNISVMVKES